MTRNGTIGVGAVLLAGVALLLAWFFLTHERKEITVAAPRKGEAVYNRLFALKIALENSGQRVHSRSRTIDPAQPLGRNDTLVLNGDPASVLPHDARVVLDWVKAGGHLVVAAPGANSMRESKDALLAPFQVFPYDFEEDAPCLYVDTPPPASKKQQQPGAGEVEDDEDASPYTEFCSQRFQLAKDGPEPAVEWSDEFGYVYTRFVHGAGSVDVVGSIYPLRTPILEHHVPLVRQLLAPNWNRGAFHIVYASEMPSFWRMLFENGWMAIVPLALLLLLWLRMRAQRFGPLVPAAPEARRSLLEHVQASGEHLYRYGRAHLLHQALRRHVLARIRRRDPVAASLEGQAQVAALAQRTGLPATDVADALQTPRPHDARDFRHRIARLISLGRNA
jgi:hypothetical protein